MSRSAWKPPFVNPDLLTKVRKMKDGSLKKGILNTRARNCTIIPAFIGLTFGVYNGKKYVPVMVSENMIGMKLGEFSPTRNHPGYSNLDKKSKR